MNNLPQEEQAQMKKDFASMSDQEWEASNEKMITAIISMGRAYTAMQGIDEYKQRGKKLQERMYDALDKLRGHKEMDKFVEIINKFKAPEPREKKVAVAVAAPAPLPKEGGEGKEEKKEKKRSQSCCSQKEEHIREREI